MTKVHELHDNRDYSNTGVFERRVREIATHYFARSIGFLAQWTWEHEFVDAGGNLLSRRVFTKKELVSYKVQ